MPTPAFGFSVGDFIAGIKLVKDLVDSLDEVSGAKPHFRSLITELRHLERALTEVKALQVDLSQASQKLALEQVALQCQDCIEAFFKKNTKIQDALCSQSTASAWRANLRKFQWTICRQDAVDKFRAEVKGHVLTINTLLATIQADSKADSLVKTNNEMLNAQTDLWLTFSQAITSCSTQQQSQELHVIMQKVLQTNMKIFQLVIDMQKAQQAQIPLQIDRQQPVYFEDAHGRLAPFHIEFINSFEAFQAVMEVRFRHVPGLKKVQGNRYTVKESNTKRVLNLGAPWESVFLPGRKVVMSMIFHVPQTTTMSCPGCQSENEVSTDEWHGEVLCANSDCGLWYERISEAENRRGSTSSHGSRQKGKRTASDSPESSAKRTRHGYQYEYRNRDDQHDLSDDDSDDEDTVQQFRRVQVVLKQPSGSRSKMNAQIV
ncbi:hypothetical protein EK21DRAFT_102145 [Setomelanomma holmii]|uniref:Ubiquitin-like domain-containing protein n=1 Tax=Setomelanomma holmii TaxID=210430 RepID=A0A9P4H6F0_9PLEO|nr:hypothetical protein EK21DRAFT_102145 [Setomelanomma holmii]